MSVAVFDMAERFLRERLGIVIELGGGVRYSKPEPPSRSFFDAELDSFTKANCVGWPATAIVNLEKYAAAAAGVRPMPRIPEDYPRKDWT